MWPRRARPSGNRQPLTNAEIGGSVTPEALPIVELTSHLTVGNCLNCIVDKEQKLDFKSQTQGSRGP